MNNNISINGVCRQLFKNNRFAVFMHENPDADTIGSCFALVYTLRGLGKEAYPVCCDRIPSSLCFLTDGAREFGIDSVPDDRGVLFISVDVASAGQLGSLSYLGSRVSIALDHHGAHDSFSEFRYVDSEASACSEIVYRVINRMLVGEIPEKTASLLYAALAADTGGFRYANTTPYAHKIAAKLIERGANHALICHNLFECKSKQALAAEAFAVEHVSFFKGGKISFIKITLDDKRALGIQDEDTYDVINTIRRVEGVRVAMFAREREDGTYKISTRSSGDPDMARLCGMFGGGGHTGAAGCSVPAAEADAAVERIIEGCGFDD